MKITRLRLAIFLCIAMAVLLAAMQAALDFVFAFLIPFWSLLAYVVITAIPWVREVCKAPAFPTLSPFSSRPPPVK